MLGLNIAVRIREIAELKACGFLAHGIKILLFNKEYIALNLN